MNEVETRVAQHLREAGFRIFTKGWPDLLAIRDDGVVMFVEVKRNDQQRRGTVEQELILELLGKIYRQEVEPSFTIMRPRDLWELDLQIHLCAGAAKESNLNSNSSSSGNPN